MHNRNIKLTIMYDGTNYSGWQRLGESSLQESIQGTLEIALSKVLNDTIKVIGAGRTDQGVHAFGSAANFHTSSSLTIEEIRRELNKFLPEDIRIVKVEEVEKQFHSRRSCISKTYIYRIDNNEIPCVFTRRYTYHHENQLDIVKMQKAANYLVGIHDFKAFSSPMKDKRTTVREIYSIIIEKNTSWGSCFQNKNEIVIAIKGNGFLYNMVRIIVGTLIEVGEGKKVPRDIKRILQSKDRSLAGPMAQYQGLILKEVNY